MHDIDNKSEYNDDYDDDGGGLRRSITALIIIIFHLLAHLALIFRPWFCGIPMSLILGSFIP